VRPGTPRAQLLKRALDELSEAEALPGPDDYRTGIPPVMTAWVRPIPRVSLWVYYSFDESKVVVSLVRDSPPEAIG
jgi:hypothetical protein